MSARQPGTPLEGVTVVALEHAVAAPFATRQLADLGARVVKIERVDGGDFARGYDHAVGGTLSSIFAWLGRGKESVALDLKQPPGREILDRLIAEADVFVQNLAPGAIERMGYAPADLVERYPRLIVASNSGYGRTGPYAGKRAYDTLVQSEAGAVAVTGSDDRMVKPGFSAADIACGQYVHSGILMALYQRERTGRGTVIDVAMFDAITDYIAHHIYFAQATGRAAPRVELGHPSLAPYGAFPTADGEQVVIGVQNDREWARLCEHLIGDGTLVDDPRTATNNARNANRDFVQGLVADATSRLSRDDLTATLDEATIAWGRINSLDDAAAHPQHHERDRWVNVGTPAGPMPMFRQVITERGKVYPAGEVPAHGQHTGQVLRELGYDTGRIADLIANGVVVGPPDGASETARTSHNSDH